MYRVTTVEERQFMELECCLSHFNRPNMCDVKMGTRTFLESEVKSSVEFQGC